MSECVMFIASAKIPARKFQFHAISAGPKLDFLSHPTTSHPPTIKAPLKDKN